MLRRLGSTHSRLALCVLPLLFLTACPKARPAIGAGLRQADQLLSEGQPSAALAAYQAAIDEPPPGHALRGVGLCHEVLGAAEPAIEALEGALKHLPDDPVVRLSLSRLYANTGERQKAKTHAAYVFQHHPDNLTALILLAALADTADQLQQAIERLVSWRDDPTQKRAPVTELYVALWDLWLRKGNTQIADKVWAESQNARLGHPDTAVLMSGVYVSTGRLLAAERLLVAVVTAHPKRADAQRRLAFLASDLDHYALANQALATFESNPEKLDETVLRARVRVALGQAATVLPELRERIAQSDARNASTTRRAQLRYWLGKALTQTGELQAAATQYADAITIWSEMIPAHLALAELRLQQGELTQAVSGLEAAIAIDPKAPDLYGLLGSARMTQGEYALAEAAFRQRAALTPKDATGPHLIGAALKAQGKDDLAAVQFRQALAIDPAAVDPLEALSSSLLAAHKEAEAEALHQRAVSAAPSRVEAWIAFARFYARAGNTTRAAAVIQQALRQAPDHVGALGEAAQIAIASGQYAEAERHTTRLLAVAPNSVVALNNLAVLYDEHLSQPDKALEAAKKARALAPNDPNLQDTLGWILHRRGQHQEALALLAPSAQALSTRAMIQFHYGMALLANGDASQGKAQLRKALALNPNFQGAAQARAAL